MTQIQDPRALDEVLVAMDVVDTLRHRDIVLQKELDQDGRQKYLVARLREIYTAQGITVTDEVLLEGVRALEEQRFVYAPPTASLQVRLAKLYVSRGRWGKPFIGALAALGVAVTSYQFGVVQPARAKAAATEQALSVTLPTELSQRHQAVLELSQSEKANQLADTYFADGQNAIARSDLSSAQAAIENLNLLQSDLSVSYDVRVVYGPGEPRSGIFRIPDDAPSTRNYYLIVEAIDAAGRSVAVPLESEETRQIKRVSRWAQRVSETAFNEVASDKLDDQIIQNAVIGRKTVGAYAPTYSVATPGGVILEW